MRSRSRFPRLAVPARWVSRLAAPVGALVLMGAVEACVIFRSVRYESVPIQSGRVVESAVKAHLLDGSTIMFPNGVTIEDEWVRGVGTRYDISLSRSGTVASVRLDSVLAMESFRTQEDLGKSFLVSTLTTLGVIGGAVAIACAADPKCFGSCPTVYSDSAGVQLLEAEGFSYSVAPIFESRDVDRLRAGVDGAGEVRLEIRNEAFETHYLNHLELIETRHAVGEFVAPGPGGRPVALSGPVRIARATDRDGRDVLQVLLDHDGEVFTSSPERIRLAANDAPDGTAGVEDHIDLDVHVPAGSDVLGLLLRMRNSLLATVLFYDLMLGDRGPRALDWLAQDLQEIGPAVELAQWAAENLGMRIDVLAGGEWSEVTRIADTGPVAWNDIAVVVPVDEVSTASSVTIRLTFLADHWRIDQVTPFAAARYAGSRVIPLATVEGPDGSLEQAALTSLAAPDEHYLVTSPGERFDAVFRPDLTSPGLSGTDADRVEESRTFFLASQGYYIEWVRQRWLIEGRDTTAFEPGPEALVEALRRWSGTRESMERHFYATKVPVR